MSMPDDHSSPAVRDALVRLSDALCGWERVTGRESVLILREVGRFCYRAVNGKPGVPEDVTDEELMRNCLG